jgi:hypothetical protein
MKYLRSISIARALVKGSDGDPAITMTSMRPPFLAHFALRDFWLLYALLYV